MTARYALYYAPLPDSALWRFGSELIGYDAASGAELDVPSDAPVEASQWRAWTEEPRRYGFHATLKAPFEMREGADEEALCEAVSRLAAGLEPVVVPRLEPGLLGPFVALVPALPCPALQQLAASCVIGIEGFRAPLRPEERARRLRNPMTARQLAHLDCYGYPYVLDEFRFHMTLTGSLPHAAREPVRAWISARYRALMGPVTVDQLAVFRQPDREARFRLVRRFALPSSSRVLRQERLRR